MKTTTTSYIPNDQLDFYSADYTYHYDESELGDDVPAASQGNTIFDVNNMLGVLDTEMFNPLDSMFVESSAEGRISLAYERLSQIPRPIADNFALNTHTLDLSHNSIKNLSFLVNFKHLNTLILDKNETPDVDTLPALPDLKILWINNCHIYNLSKWIKRLQVCCPNLRHLSLLGNPGIMSIFNGGTMSEDLDYRMFVVASLPRLEYLDDTIITSAQRVQSLNHKSAYTAIPHIGGSPLHFVQKFTGGSGQFLNLFRYDRPKRSRPSTATASAATTATRTDRRTKATKKTSTTTTDSSSQS